jgi:integrase
LFGLWSFEEKPSEQTKVEYERSIRRFSELHANLSAIAITKVHAREFKTALMRLPSRLNKQQLQMTMLEVLKDLNGKAIAETLATETINKSLSGISAVLSWADKNGYFESNLQWSNPTAGLTITNKNKTTARLPLDKDDLGLLFNSKVYSDCYRPKGGSGEASYWLPYLALYTGTRLGELGQLLVEDVRRNDSIWYLSINEFSDGKKVKNKGPIRNIPIHNKLVELGFLTYVQSQKNRKVFPNLVVDKRSNLTGNWSKWFGRYKKSIGITDSKKVFHSFRHTFKDAL